MNKFTALHVQTVSFVKRVFCEAESTIEAMQIMEDMRKNNSIMDRSHVFLNESYIQDLEEIK